MKTCVSMNCPFIPFCGKYNFLTDRSPKCEIQEEIVKRAKELMKEGADNEK